ncbi:MAG: hypothetical protein IKP58_09105 [Victivallales bacterium]|nr:hypothetical protein [Victivallales bacterium]
MIFVVMNCPRMKAGVTSDIAFQANEASVYSTLTIFYLFTKIFHVMFFPREAPFEPPSRKQPPTTVVIAYYFFFFFTTAEQTEATLMIFILRTLWMINSSAPWPTSARLSVYSVYSVDSF